MNATKIIEKKIKEELGIEKEKITREARFDEDFNLGQEEFGEFIISLEETLGIESSQEEIKQVKTVGSLVDIVQDHLDEVE